MIVNLLPTSVLASLLLLGACGGGSSGSHHPRGDVVDTPEAPDTDIVPAVDYVMPPLVDVIPPSDDFAPACDDIVMPGDDVTPPIADDIIAGGNTGFLIDSSVSGLAYETPTHRGVTGLDGSFRYEDGETVRFMLGDTLLGEVTGQTQITPFDLAGSPVVTRMPTITWALDNDDHPFHTVINIAVLLQSLDQDADPKNGIEITPEVAALFRGVSLDLSQQWLTFFQEFGLLHALEQANAQDLFSDVRGVVRPAPALQHLYEDLGINARTFGVSLEQSGGSAYESPDYTSRWDYDISGNVTRRESSGSDGRVHGVESWAYDTRGSRIRYEREVYGQESTESWQYDASGKLKRYEAGGDGRPGSIAIYQYRSDGKLVRVERDVLDDIGDGTSGSITTYRYDADSKLVHVELNGGDLGLTAEMLGIPDIQYLGLAETYSVTYSYDAGGNLTADVRDGSSAEYGRNVESRQYDAKGNVTRFEGRLERYGGPEFPAEEITINEYEYEYDTQGNMTRKLWDADADGKPEDIISYEYDTNGNVTREVGDWDADGKPDEIISYEYDTNGNVTREIIEWNADGEPDEIISYEYDIQGNLTRLEQDYDADGTAEDTESWPYQYEYDTQGNLARRLLDQNGDGRPNEILSYAYHANGNLAQEEHWSTEGEEHDISIWQYGPGGKLKREESDYGGNGTADTIVNYEYDLCGGQKWRRARDGEGKLASMENWQYDAGGQLRRHEWNNRPFEFFGGDLPDGFPILQSTGVESWQYDAQGRVMRYQFECNGECFIVFLESLDDQIVNYEYDSNGNITRELSDRDGDGRPDRVMAYQYDANGNVTRELSDEDGDNEPDRVTSYQYDVNDNLTRREEDYDGDGRPDSIDVSEYDANGNTTLETSDQDGDGTPDHTATFQHQYDANGNHTRAQEDRNGDGAADHIKYWEYDANGKVTRHDKDQDGDGVLNYIEIREYDTNGKLVRVAIDDEGDGTPDRVRSYQYDADSNLTREDEVHDWDGDGVPEETVTRHYIATGWGHIFTTPAAY